MQASDYLRMKFNSDRHLALLGQRARQGVMQSARGVASDIYSGIERASWYSSCFIPGYNDVCQELRAEEIRSFYSIESIFRYHDVIAHMLYLYFQLVCDDIGQGNQDGSARKFIKKMTGVAAHMNVAGGTRYAFASAASVAIAQSNFMKKIVVERLSSRVSQAVFVLQFYGIQQKSALAARHLKAMSPDYYWLLYQAKLEMLYYFIEPLLAEIIKRVTASAFSNLDALADYIHRSYGV